ncbi:MAG: DMT family transporter [Cytophagales bacterium]|nr:DMT family transporter [Cytophagales bacterium]
MKLSQTLKSWLYFLSLTLIWGSAFILIKKGLLYFSPAQGATFRIFTGFVVLLPLIINILRKNKFSKKEWRGFTIVGFVGSFIPAFLFAQAQIHISSSTSGVLGALTPAFALLISFFVFKAKIKALQIVGMLLGLAGTVSLVFLTKGGNFDLSNLYALLILLATFCYASNTNFVKFNLSGVNPLHIACLSLVVTGPLSGIYLLSTDFISIAQNPASWWSLGALFTLGVTATATGLILFNQFIKIATPLFASSVTYAMPLVALIWGLLDNEVLGMYHLLGMGAVILGVFLINRK